MTNPIVSSNSALNIPPDERSRHGVYSGSTPASSFPYALDDDTTLLRVFDMSESVLEKDLLTSGDIIFIKPRYDLPEVWAKDGGYLHIDDIDGLGEDVYYSRTRVDYAPSDEVGHTGGFFISQLDVAELQSAMVVNGLKPHRNTGFNSVTLKDQGYTIAGQIKVGQADVEFAVKGNGPHGAGSQFFVSRPDLVQTQFCSIDADKGILIISTIDFGWILKNCWWIIPVIDANGEPMRRVVAMEGLIRNLRGSGTRDYPAGTMIRGYIMAEHHNLLNQALKNIEGHVGVDFSDVRPSLDFRLRDLSELCLEDDDFGCPQATAIFTERIQEDVDPSCFGSKIVDYQLQVVGEFNRFGVFFGDGTSTTSSLEGSHTYPSASRVEPSVFVANDRCQVSNAFFDQETQVQDIPEVPVLACPDILIPEIPPIPEISVDFQPFNQTINIDWSVTFPSITFPSVTFPSITFPEFTWPSFTWPSFTFPEISISIVLTINNEENPESGPCFQLVQCSPGYHHPGYH